VSTPHVHVRGAVDDGRLDVGYQAHALQQPAEELLRHAELLLELLGGLLRRAAPWRGRGRSHPNDRRLRSEPEKPRAALLDDLHVRFLFADAELRQGGLDGFLNACGASFDLRHRFLRFLAASRGRPAGAAPRRRSGARSRPRPPPTVAESAGAPGPCSIRRSLARSPSQAAAPPPRAPWGA